MIIYWSLYVIERIGVQLMMMRDALSMNNNADSIGAYSSLILRK
jgi:hypothetical protein